MSKKLFPLISIIMIAAFALAACATPTAAPTMAAPTTAPQRRTYCSSNCSPNRSTGSLNPLAWLSCGRN
jgi:uncharacterized lipoprotein YajG